MARMHRMHNYRKSYIANVFSSRAHTSIIGWYIWFFFVLFCADCTSRIYLIVSHFVVFDVLVHHHFWMCSHSLFPFYRWYLCLLLFRRYICAVRSHQSVLLYLYVSDDFISAFRREGKTSLLQQITFMCNLLAIFT